MHTIEYEKGSENIVKIKVIGIGGGGNNVVNRLMEEGVTNAETVAVNTDAQCLNRVQATHKLNIGVKQTGGKGAGADPEVGRKAMEESQNEMTHLLEGTDMVFIAAGMGGGTGTGAAPIVAKLAREMNILTIGVVTKPFTFEGAVRMRTAEKGIEELLGHVDSLIVVPNERLKEVSVKKITFVTAFKIADDILRQAVQAISDIIIKAQLVNVDFADVSTIMKGAGFAHIGVGWASGENRAEEAAKMAIHSPLLETTINGARGILLNIIGDEDLSLEEVDLAANMVKGAVDPECTVIFGASITEGVPDGEGTMRVIVIATKFNEEEPAAAPSESSSLFGSTGSVTPLPVQEDDPYASFREQPSLEVLSPLPQTSAQTNDRPDDDGPDDDNDPFRDLTRIFRMGRNK